ncbi:hypothetical protein Natpe_2684 [Natrinema pellirubrum DSM 15624]|uniref:Integral membrane protein n=2 Tax=Natrinema pellirubrum (strain DSM 15624 / CIP 106293 / JCM 10476 / NCIMB 786 / 157) TaxID=797303 RepID=L0JLS9_NATP1|nr:hypothetical protein [Natrinema pellirubrum]AGB32490.1 hypothetical protein Natpe_2684 [Natrinema pellirubrum DSM 15624]
MSNDWPDKRRETAYTEARAVIDAQNTTMADIDDKAMRTVRLNTILLGLLVTGLQFAPGMFHMGGLQAAFGFLILSTLCGVITYNESNLYVGPRGEYIEDLAEDDFPDPPWEEDLLETMAGMIAENYDDIRRNSGLLTATQATLVLGIIGAVTAVAI